MEGTSSVDILPLDQRDCDLNQEQQEATPRRQPARPRPRERPEVEVVLTQLTNVLIDVQRNQQRAAAAQPVGAP